MYKYNYPRALNTVDIIVINSSKYVLLIKRANEPYLNMWALPGGFIEMNEALIDSAIRELEEETSLKNIKLTQFKTYGNPNRDPRGRNIATVFYGSYDNKSDAKAGDDACDAMWFDLNTLPPMAFDHKEILYDFINEIL